MKGLTKLFVRKGLDKILKKVGNRLRVIIAAKNQSESEISIDCRPFLSHIELQVEIGMSPRIYIRTEGEVGCACGIVSP
jgi:hypothetical protein